MTKAQLIAEINKLEPDGVVPPNTSKSDLEEYLAKAMKQAELVKRAFHCTARHYDDRPHLWVPVEDKEHGSYEQHVWSTAAQLQANRNYRTCCEHHPPVTNITPEMLAVYLTVGGFQYQVTEEKWYGNSSPIITPVLKLTGIGPNEGITIELKFHSQTGEKVHSYTDRASGHTSFTTAQGERTFDRTGVDDSFHVLLSDDVPDIRVKIEREVERVAASRARIANSIPVPQIGFLVTPQTKEEISAKLKQGKSHSFTPSGFGTGYCLYSRRQQSRYDRRAGAELEQFFGVSPIFMQTLDCD